MKKYISFDIGGTMIKYGIINEIGEIVENHETPTEAGGGGPHIMQRVRELIELSRREYSLSGICIATAGMVDHLNGKIIYANESIPNYTGIEMKKILEAEFHIPCEVENDVSCAGLSEQLTGASKGSKVSLCLTIGTGIGGCIIIDNKIFHGAFHSAGEVGYMNMNGSNFQKTASTSALVSKVASLKECDSKELNGIKIFELAQTGDRICMDAIDELCDNLGYGIANICYVINPEVVVLGGGITKQKEYLYERIRKSMDKYLIEEVGKKTKLVFAENGNQAGILGAFLNFKNNNLR